MPRHVIFLCLIGISASLASAAPPLIHHDFEKDASGWIAYGADSAHVQVTHDPALVQNGKGALEFDYEARADHPAVALLPVHEPLERMQSIRLFLHAETATAIAILLSEKEGGRYFAVAWVPAHEWQRVEVTPEDFILGTNEGDPSDPAGKLDLDEIRAIGVLDLSQILQSTLGDGSSLAVIAHEGRMKLSIDDFEVSTERPEWYQPRPHGLLDDFTHPQLDWLTLGGADLLRDTSGKVLPAKALEASYQLIDDRFVILLHPLPPTDLRDATHLSLDIASDKNINLVVSLTERVIGKTEGPHYNADLVVKGGGKPVHREIPFSAFERDEDGPADSNGKLDLDHLKDLGILDVTNAYTGETGVNTIRIANIQAIRKTAPPEK